MASNFDRRCPCFGDRCTGFGSRFESLEGVAHGVVQLAVAVGRHVDDPGPGGDPPHFVGLGDARTALDGLETVAPHGGFAPPSSVTKANSPPGSAVSTRP